MAENGKPLDVNVRVGLMKREKKPAPKRGTGKKILKILLITILVIVVGIAAAVGIVYAAKPNIVDSFTHYNTNNEGQPVTLKFRYYGIWQCYVVEYRNVATGKSEIWTKWKDDQNIMYLNEATGAMTLMGEEFDSRNAVKADSDKARIEQNVSRKLIEMSKGRDRVSNSLTRTELAWIMLHPKDASYFGLMNKSKSK